jgi:DNA-binding response OmpR family regulator
MKALLIEDSASVRRIIRGILLSTCKFTEVVQKENGALGLEEILKNHASYDLTILDWQMPVMDGIEVLKKVRQAKINIPIIICTSSGKRETIIEAITAGANDYLVKPFLPINLEQKIYTLFNSKKQTPPKVSKGDVTTLIIDHSPIVRAVIKKVLLKEKNIKKVLEADNGPSALKIFLNGSIDLLIIDWETPQISGIEIVKAIRNENQEIPIIIIQENSTIEHMVEAFDAGITGFLKKPYSHNELLAKVENVLEATN